MFYILKELLYRVRGEYSIYRLQKRGLKVGKNLSISTGVILDPSHCWLITIGDNVTIAPRVHILAHDASTKKIIDYTKIGRVDIGNNVFIGADSIVLPNVVIDENVIIGAGSVVTKNIPSNSVYAGNPAKYVCSVEEYTSKHRIIMSTSSVYDSSFTLREKISHQKRKEMYSNLENKTGYIE